MDHGDGVSGSLHTHMHSGTALGQQMSFHRLHQNYSVEKPVFPADTELSEKLLGKDAHKEAMDHAIPEFLNFNIVECEIING